MPQEITLISLAMLKLKYDQGTDYLDYLKPFVINIISMVDSGEQITDLHISEQVLNNYGLSIPQQVIQLLLKRLARDGIIYKENHAYYIKMKKDVSEWRIKMAESAKKINYILKSLIEFSKESMHMNIDESYAIDSFSTFLSKFSISCLRYYLRHTALPDLKSHKNEKVVLVSEFIKHISETSPEKFDAFMVLAQGHMLANALLCNDLSALKSNYKKVTFYFDTALLLSALGLNGQEKKRAIHELISIVKQLGGNIAYFSHTLDELTNVIDNAAKFVDNGKGRGSVIFHARESGKTRSDLMFVLMKVEELLSSTGINCVNTPQYIEKYQIDESQFGNFLDEEITYSNKKAREHDINSMRSIFVLRGSIRPRVLEKCSAVFVTSNSLFASAAQEYCDKIENSSDVSPVITDFSLMNISWLKAPMGAPTLPEKEILSFAYAALVPSKIFWDKVIDEVEKLSERGEISERDHQLLRSSTAVLSDLMALTLGNDASLSSQSIKEALRRVSEEIKQEESHKTLTVIKERDAFRAELQNKDGQLENIVKKIYWDVDKRVKRESSIVSAVLLAFLSIICCTSVLQAQSLNVSLKYLLLFSSVVISIVGYFVPIQNKTVRDFYYNKRFNNALQKEYDKYEIKQDI